MCMLHKDSTRFKTCVYFKEGGGRKKKQGGPGLVHPPFLWTSTPPTSFCVCVVPAAFLCVVHVARALEGTMPAVL